MATHSLKLPLFLTRISIVLFMLPWQLMRFTKPDSIANIGHKYYKLPHISEAVSLATGVFMMALLLAFLCGFKKKLSYGLVFALHGIGTVMTLPFLIPGLPNYNQLFLAAIPTTAALWLLFVLRDEDTMLALDSHQI